MPNPSISADLFHHLLERWRNDPNGTYQSWFLWEERLKNFRSIRQGLQAVIAEIKADTFGNLYRGSSLETVVHSIAEQRQIFKGADHAFLWKPKLRIPDIYEHRGNQLAFGHFLDTCLCCNQEKELVSAIHQLDSHTIKGLGPACANLLYFLHPTITPPFNTAIVKGYNLLTGANVKLGRWSEYLAMRQGMLAINSQYRKYLSNDLGALAGLLFDLGNGRYIAPPRQQDAEAIVNWQAALSAVQAESTAHNKALAAARDNDQSHTEIQGWLRDLGHALGYSIWIASNDRNRPYGQGKLGDNCLGTLAIQGDISNLDTVRLIDVLWLDSNSRTVIAAFEVEHSTSIYSGIVRMLDLALGVPEHVESAYFLVAPDERERDVRTQFARPAFSRVKELNVRYLPYSELKQHRESMMRFGSGLKGVLDISRPLV